MQGIQVKIVMPSWVPKYKGLALIKVIVALQLVYLIQVQNLQKIPGNISLQPGVMQCPTNLTRMVEITPLQGLIQVKVAHLAQTRTPVT